MKKRKSPEGNSSGKRVRKHRSASLSSYALTLFVLAVLVIVAAGYVFMRTAASVRAARLNAEAASVGRILARRVDQAVSDDFARMAAVAAENSVVSAMSPSTVSGDSAKAVAASLRPVFPEAERVLLLPAGMTTPDLTADPPMGYALLAMMRQAERTGKAPPAELHFPGENKAQVNFLQPVTAGGKVVGHLLVTYPPKYLNRLIGSLNAGDGQAELEQVVGGSHTALVRVGASSTEVAVPPVRLAIPKTRWVLIYRIASASPDWRAVGAPTLLAGGAVFFGLLALVVFSVFGAARRRLKADAATLAAMAGGGTSAGRTLGLTAELGPAFAALQARSARMSTSKSGSVAGKATSASADEVSDDEVSDDEVSDDEVSDDEVSDEVLPSDTLGGLEVIEEEVGGEAATEGEHPQAEEETPRDEPETEEPSAVKEQKAMKRSADAMRIDHSILRAYDIRGVVGPSFNAGVVGALGRAIGSTAQDLGQREIVVGRDGRLSSDELAEALIQGLVRSGREVIDIGRVPTPLVYFATFHLDTQAGVMITGSHNPGNYNGLKIMLGGETLSGEAVQALGRRVEAGDFEDGHGTRRREDVVPEYIDRITQDITLHRPLRLVVDCGNGVAGEVAPQLFRALGCEVEELFCDVDGRFPHHHPDPSVPENLQALASLVRLQEADIGLAFDGDGDRLGVVDAEGTIIWADRQMMLYARDVLSRNPGADIIFDVKCSAHLAHVITDNAGVPLMWKTGHSLVKRKLRETGAPLAGEMSGHIFFAERWYGFDDALYSAARLLEIISMDSRSTVDIFNELPNGVSTPELHVDLTEGEPPKVVEALLAQADFKNARLTTIDGLRVDFPDGWGLVRASNTTPCLVLRFEGDTPEALDRIKESFRDLLLNVKPDAKLPF